MWPNGFSDSFPGRLEPTTVEERVRGKQPPEYRSRQTFAFVPGCLPPADLDVGALVSKIWPIWEGAERRLGELEGRLADLPNPQLLVAPLIQRESILSSKIENTNATAEELALFDVGQPPEKHDTVEVANYRRALQHGLASELPVCIRLIRDMHSILLHGARGENKSPGRVRTTQNWIGRDEHDFRSARFVPPPPERVEECLRDLELFLNRRNEGLPLLAAIAIAHYQFEAIHPFNDGNGRLGRLLVSLSLCRNKRISYPLVYVSGFFETHRSLYYDLLLAVSTKGDWISWIEFFLTAVAEQAQDSLERVRRIKLLQRDVEVRLEAGRAPHGVHQLVAMLIEHPATTVAHAANRLGVSGPTATAYIDRLEKLGFLRERTGGSYARVWVADEIISVVES